MQLEARDGSTVPGGWKDIALVAVGKPMPPGTASGSMETASAWLKHVRGVPAKYNVLAEAMYRNRLMDHDEVCRAVHHCLQISAECMQAVRMLCLRLFACLRYDDGASDCNMWHSCFFAGVHRQLGRLCPNSRSREHTPRGSGRRPRGG